MDTCTPAEPEDLRLLTGPPSAGPAVLLVLTGPQWLLPADRAVPPSRIVDSARFP